MSESENPAATPASLRKGPAAVAKRVVCALATAALAVSLFLYAPLWVAPPLIVLLGVLCQAELCAMAKRAGDIMPFAACAATAAILAAFAYLPLYRIAEAAAISLIVLFAVCVCGIFAKSTGRGAGAIASTLGAIAYIAPQMACFLLFAKGGRQGVIMLFYIVCCVKISDMGGYAFGKAFGKHKLCPSVSPAKSWEGLAGGIFGSVLVSCIFCAVATGSEAAGADAPFANFFWKNLTYPAAAGLGVFFCIAGTLGDLAESKIKRACGVKDSSVFLPAGMGGFLDMFDSILFAPALFMAGCALAPALCGLLLRMG